MSKFQKFLDKFGWFGLVPLCVYPFLLLITTPVRLFQTLYSLRCLVLEPWCKFSRMTAHRSLNSSWHRAYDLLMERYGRNGYAYDISLGRSLATYFSLTKFSMRLYRQNEVLIPWLGTAVMVLSQLIWLSNVLEPWNVLVTLILGLFSTLFYFGAFEALKYDSLGWALVPLGYYALLTGNLWLFSLIFLGITFLSVSVAIVQGALWFLVGLFVQGPLIFLAFLLGGLKLLSHFRFMVQGEGFAGMQGIVTGIGLSGSGARKRRLGLEIGGIYLLGLWVSYWVALWFLAEPSSFLTRLEQLLVAGLPILLYLINKRFRRFADEQTIYMLIFCAFSLVTLQQAPGILLLFLWLALSPMPLFLGFTAQTNIKDLIWKVPRLRPYRIGPVRDFCTAFMAPVLPHARLLFHFDYDPERYPNFAGLRGMKEYLHYLALECQAVIVPDLYLVFDSYAGRFPLADLYQDGSPQGRREAMVQIGARFLILPSASPELSAEWREADFALRTIMDLAEGCEKGLWSQKAYRQEYPYLLLLEAEGLQTSLTVCGTLLEMTPNHLRIQLDEQGESVVKLLYVPGWKSSAKGTVDAWSGKIPWIHVKGNANSIVELNFDYFGSH